MNATNIKSLLTEDKFMPEMHLRKSAFNYKDFRTFRKNKEGMQKLKKAGYFNISTRKNWTRLVFNMI